MKFKHVVIVLAWSALVAGTSHASIIEIGRIDLSGDFTLNHNYNFNNPSAQPFGSFSNVTAVDASGIFAGHIAPGDPLTMNPVDLLQSGEMWMIGGFTLTTGNDTLSITGPDAGRFVQAPVDLTGNGFDPAAFNVGFGDAFSRWVFTAPPYDISNFPSDVTGPIQLTITTVFENGHVPEPGSTFAFLALGIVTLVLVRQAQKIQVGR